MRRRSSIPMRSQRPAHRAPSRRGLLFTILYFTLSSSELFCKKLDPFYAVATGFKGEIVLWMSLTSLALLLLGGFVVKMFWCKYICPLGAASNIFVLHHAQQLVDDAARRDIDLQVQFFPGTPHPLADGAQRTEVSAKKFAEQNHSHGEHEAHHDLEHRHRAGQRVVHHIGAESLQPAKRTICLDIDGFVAQFGPKHRARNGGQYAPLQQVLQIIRFTFHLLLFVLCVFVCAGVRITPCP